MPKINPWLIVTVVIGLIVLIVSIVILIETGHDATEFVTLIGVLLTTVAGFIGTLIALASTKKDVTTIKGNTNGTLTALKGQVDDLHAQVAAAAALLPTDQAQAVLATVAPVTASVPVVAPDGGTNG